MTDRAEPGVTPLTEAERECVEVCTSSCHADDCEHHGFIATRATSTPAAGRLDPEDYDIGENGAVIPRATSTPAGLREALRAFVRDELASERGDVHTGADRVADKIADFLQGADR